MLEEELLQCGCGELEAANAFPEDDPALGIVGTVEVIARAGLVLVCVCEGEMEVDSGYDVKKRVRKKYDR